MTTGPHNAPPPAAAIRGRYYLALVAAGASLGFSLPGRYPTPALSPWVCAIAGFIIGAMLWARTRAAFAPIRCAVDGCEQRATWHYSTIPPRRFPSSAMWGSCDEHWAAVTETSRGAMEHLARHHPDAGVGPSVFGWRPRRWGLVRR